MKTLSNEQRNLFADVSITISSKLVFRICSLIFETKVADIEEKESEHFSLFEGEVPISSCLSSRSYLFTPTMRRIRIGIGIGTGIGIGIA